MNTGLFSKTKEHILSGSVSLMADNLYIMLMRPGFIYNPNSVIFDNIAGLEIESTLYYQAGGVLIDGATVSTVDGRAELRISPVEYQKIDATVSGYVIYAKVTTVYGLTDPLLFYGLFDEQIVFTSSIFRLNWPDPVFKW